MNEIRRIESEADEIAAIRAIVGRHAVPDFVSGFNLTLGSYDDEPIVVINFHIEGEWPRSVELRKAKAGELNELSRIVRGDLIENYPARYPYFEFGHEPPTA